LDLILSDLGLDYRVANDVLVITTCDVALDATELRVYDVRNLHQGKLEAPAIAGMLEKTFADREDHRLSVIPFGELLVVRDNQRGHREIEALLSTIELALAPPQNPPGKHSDQPKQASFEEPAEQATPAKLSPTPTVADPFNSAVPAPKRAAQ
jgi:hypothetical protein